MRNPHIVRTLPNLLFFGVFKIFWDIIWLGYCLNKIVTIGRWWNDFRKNPNPKILKNSQGYQECEESSHCAYPPKSPLIWSFSNFLGHHMAWILFKEVRYTWKVVKWFPQKSKSKNTKKLTGVRRLWGILTLCIPSQISTSLYFLKFLRTSYGLDIV